MIDKENLYYDSGSFTAKDGYSLLVYDSGDIDIKHLVVYDTENRQTEDIKVYCQSL